MENTHQQIELFDELILFYLKRAWIAIYNS